MGTDHGLSSALTEKPDETSVNVRLVTGERGRRLKGEKKNQNKTKHKKRLLGHSGLSVGRAQTSNELNISPNFMTLCFLREKEEEKAAGTNMKYVRGLLVLCQQTGGDDVWKVSGFTFCSRIPADQSGLLVQVKLAVTYCS